VFYLETGNYEQAIADFDRAIALDENHDWAIANRGFAYREMGLYEQAIADFEKSILLDEKDTWTYVNRGITYRAWGKYEHAIADFDKAFELDQEDLGIVSERGFTYLQMGRHKEALADFDTVILQGSNKLPNLLIRAHLYWTLDDLDKSLSDYNQAIILDNNNHAAYEAKSIVLRSLTQYQDALDSLSHTGNEDTPCFTCTAHRGEIYRRLGNMEKALNNLNIAVKSGRKNQSYEYSRRAAVYDFANDFESRDSDIRFVLAIEDQSTATLYNKAIVCSIAKNYDEAIDWLSKAVKSNKEASVYAKYDDLFNPLRNRSDFQELIN